MEGGSLAVGVGEIRPVVHLPLILGMLRKLEIAPVIDVLLPPLDCSLRMS